MNIINDEIQEVQVGGFWGCAIGCTGGCLLTSGGVAAAMVVAVWTMS